MTAWLLLLPMLAQVPTPTQRQLLEAEDARAADPAVLLSGLRSPDANVQRVAVRAIGRLERPALRDAVIPLVRAADPGVRREAINALGQMGVAYTYGALLTDEKVGNVRAVIYETIGRIAPVPNETESVLTTGLADADVVARTGAARGLESFVRRNVRTSRPAAATLASLRSAFRANTGEEFRELVLLALNSAGDRDSATLAIALRDPSEQVRRLAVIGSRQWVDDPSPMVRYQALRVAGTCERAVKALDDSSQHVALVAVDVLGDRQCPASAIEAQADRGRNWRMRAHALVSLAKVAPDAARSRLAAFAKDPVWQVRVYAATAAKALKDSATLRTLARDAEPNVVIEAMASGADAVRALRSTHAGLTLAAATRLKGASELAAALPEVLACLDRLTATGRATVRDPRVALLERIREAGDSSVAKRLRPLLADPDPVVASLAAEIISQKSGVRVAARTTRYAGAPVPTEATMRALAGARARVTMKGIGAFTIELLADEAPVTVATFVQLAEAGRFNGLTFHRIVPNFVIQGGSPGADEYDGLTRVFMRDEVGLVRHARGTLGISTRGRDTGDGQIFVNLVDNFRLDHDYTVFARVIDGLRIVDHVQEGDVIESVRIERAKPGSR